MKLWASIACIVVFSVLVLVCHDRSLPEPGAIASPGREHDRLVKGLLESVEKSSLDFGRYADDLKYDYEGDPRLVYPLLEHLLEHPDVIVRQRVANLFVGCGYQGNRAGDVLLEIAGRKTPVIASLDGHDPFDLRLNITHMLASYRIPGSADVIWNLYQETGEEFLIERLVRVGDERVAVELLSKAKRPWALKEGALAMGEFKVERSLPWMREISEKVVAEGPSREPFWEEVVWAMFQLTGERKYLDEMMKYPNFLQVNSLLYTVDDEEVRMAMLAMLENDRTGSAGKALLGLFRRDRHDPGMVSYLLRFFSGEIRGSQVPLHILYRVASKMDHPEVDVAAARYDSRYGTSYWKFYEKHRGDWPLDDLLSDELAR